MVPLQHVAPGAIVRLIAAQPHSAGKVDAAWRLSVGSGLARLAHARHDADGVLYVHVDDVHVVRALDGHRPLIEHRLHAMLGDRVRTFRVLDATPSTHRPPAPPPPASRPAHAPRPRRTS